MARPETIKSTIKQGLQLERALRLVWRSAPGWAAGSMALIALQGLLPLLTLYLMKLIVDAVAAGLAAPDKIAALRHVLLLLLMAGLVALVGVFCRSLDAVIQEAQGQVITVSSRPNPTAENRRSLEETKSVIRDSTPASETHTLLERDSVVWSPFFQLPA